MLGGLQAGMILKKTMAFDSVDITPTFSHSLIAFMTSPADSLKKLQTKAHRSSILIGVFSDFLTGGIQHHVQYPDIALLGNPPN